MKIDKIIEKLKAKKENYQIFEKIKKQVKNEEIDVEKGFEKLYSLESINQKSK